MTIPEIDDLAERVGYGHLACCMDDQPYVVPIHYVCDKPDFLVYTMSGKKTEIIDANPNICLQIEEVADKTRWRSVVVYGRAEAITDKVDRERAIKMITAANPTLTPAISIRWRDNWIRENIEVVYRIVPSVMTGRVSKSVVRKGAAA